jgi:hypothetical protein
MAEPNRGTATPERPKFLTPAPAPDRAPVQLWGDPRDVPPPGSVAFRSQVSQILAVGPSNTGLAALQMPSRSRGVIRDYTVDIANLLPTSGITFTLRINGVPVAGWRYAQFPFASPHVGVSLIAFSDRNYVEVPNGATVDVLVSVTDAVAYFVGVDFAGWSYPEDLRYYGQLR